MANLIAIGYPNQSTASAVADAAQRLDGELSIEPDAVAVIRRDREGNCHVTTSHHAVGAGASWGMFWDLLFGLLFFIPVFGMRVGAGLGALMHKIDTAGIDRQFREDVRDMLLPGTSAVFLVVDKASPEKVIEALSQYGGIALRSPLSDKAEAELQEELRGAVATA